MRSRGPAGEATRARSSRSRLATSNYRESSARWRRQGIIVAARDGNLRISIHFYNHEDDIHRLATTLGSSGAIEVDSHRLPHGFLRRLAAGRKLRDALRVTATDVSWSAFASDAPELARTVQDVLERHRFAFAGTVRRDGSPRINPVEVHVSDGRLFVVLIPRTAKAHDLDRDPRIAVQTPIASAGAPGLEVKLRARASDILDPGLRAAIAASVEEASGWRPGAQWRYCELLLASVAVLDWVDGDMLLYRWTATIGLRAPGRRHLEYERGEYTRMD